MITYFVYAAAVLTSGIAVGTSAGAFSWQGTVVSLCCMFAFLAGIAKGAED